MGPVRQAGWPGAVNDGQQHFMLIFHAPTTSSRTSNDHAATAAATRSPLQRRNAAQPDPFCLILLSELLSFVLQQRYPNV